MIATAVIGSYGKGNTYKIVRQMEERLKQLGDVDFKYLFLAEAGLADCRGCMVCLSRGEAMCPLKDGLLEIEQRLFDSDGVIFASPNHACGVTALMRRFNERFAYIAHRPRFFGRCMVAVATSGGPEGLKKTLKDLCYFVGGGFTLAGKLGFLTPPVAPSPKALQARERKINACADRLYEAMKKKRPIRPTLGGIIQFAAFRGLYRNNPALGEAKFPADMQYWRERGWLERGTGYFQKARVGLPLRLFGLLFEKVIGVAGKRMLPE